MPLREVDRNMFDFPFSSVMYEGPVVSYLTFGGGVRLFDLSIQLSVK